MFNEVTMPVITTVGAMMGSVWGLAIWISSKFTSLERLMFKQKEEILDKLEYHERHDDSRFESIRRDLFSIQLASTNRDNREREREIQKTT